MNELTNVVAENGHDRAGRPSGVATRDCRSRRFAVSIAIAALAFCALVLPSANSPAQDLAPIAVATAWPNPVRAGEPVSFSGDASHSPDPRRVIRSWEWDWDNDVPWAFEVCAIGRQQSHSFPTVGRYGRDRPPVQRQRAGPDHHFQNRPDRHRPGAQWR